MDHQINENVLAFGSAKGRVMIPIPFQLSPDDSILMTITGQKGSSEHEFVCVMDESRSNQNGTVDKIYVMKPIIPYVVPKYN
jgi:hypothetical protein